MRPDWNASGQFRVAASDFRIQTASGAAQRFLNVQFAEVDSVPFFRAQKGGAARYGKSDAAPANPGGDSRSIGRVQWLLHDVKQIRALCDCSGQTGRGDFGWNREPGASDG